MKTRILSHLLSSLKLTASRGSYAACMLMIASIATLSAQAATIGISYSFTGGPTRPPVMSGTTLIIDGLFTGSVLSGNPALNAVWNPVTDGDHSVIDLATGLLNGTFNWTFANGDKLSGNLFENVAALLASGGTEGSFTQTFTFTGGTGKFAGATGSVSGVGVATATAPTTTTGSGFLTAAGISAHEPASFALITAGLLVIAGSRRLGKPRRD